MQVKKDNFKVFLKYVDSITNLFTDLDIKGNKLSQISSNKSTILCGDLAPLFPEDLNLSLVFIKNKIPLLKLFEKSENVGIECLEHDVKINDEYSEIVLRQASPEFINNVYLSKDEIKKKLVIDENEDKVLSMELSPIVLERISTISHHFNSMNLDFNLHKKKGSINLISSEKNDRSTLVDNLECLKDFKKKTQITFSVIPFQTKFDESVVLDMFYKELAGKKISIIKLITRLKGVDSVFYIKGTVI